MTKAVYARYKIPLLFTGNNPVYSYAPPQVRKN